jgi:hypothetical protein
VLLGSDASPVAGGEDMLVKVFKLLATNGANDVVGARFRLFYITGAFFFGS